MKRFETYHRRCRCPQQSLGLAVLPVLLLYGLRTLGAMQTMYTDFPREPGIHAVAAASWGDRNIYGCLIMMNHGVIVGLGARECILQGVRFHTMSATLQTQPTCMPTWGRVLNTIHSTEVDRTRTTTRIPIHSLALGVLPYQERIVCVCTLCDEWPAAVSRRQ